MARFVVLNDFASGRFSFPAGSVIDDTTLDLPLLRSAGLAVVEHVAAMDQWIAAFLRHRANKPRATSSGELSGLLLADGLIGGAGVSSLPGFIDGVVPDSPVGSPVDEINLGPGSARDDTDTVTMVLPATETIDFTVNGAGGLDVGALAPSSAYSLWMIGDADGNARGLGSLSQLAPTLPGTHPYKRRVGWGWTDAGGGFYPFYYVGRGSWRLHSMAYRDQNDTVIAGALSSTTYETIAWTGHVPPGQRFVHARIGPQGTPTRVEFKPSDGTQPDDEGPYRTVSVASNLGQFPMFLLSPDREIDYRINSAGHFLEINCLAFVDIV